MFAVKLFKLTSYHLPHRSVESLWADVWVEYTLKPSARKVEIGPLLVSRTDVEREIEMTSEYMDEDWAQKDTEELNDVLENLKKGEFFIKLNASNLKMPTIYTSAEWITREESEKMIRCYLKFLSFDRMRFKWQKTKICIRAA